MARAAGCGGRGPPHSAGQQASGGVGPDVADGPSVPSPRTTESVGSRPLSALRDLRGSRPNSAAIAAQIEGFDADFLVGPWGRRAGGAWVQRHVPRCFLPAGCVYVAAAARLAACGKGPGALRTLLSLPALVLSCTWDSNTVIRPSSTRPTRSTWYQRVQTYAAPTNPALRRGPAPSPRSCCCAPRQVVEGAAVCIPAAVWLVRTVMLVQ